MEVLAAIADPGLNLPGLWNLTPYGALVGMLVFLFLAVARGWVIPRASHERELASANRRGDEWKETALDTRILNVELAKQNSVLTEATKTSAEFFGTVMRDGGGKHVASQEPSSA